MISRNREKWEHEGFLVVNSFRNVVFSPKIFFTTVTNTFSPKHKEPVLFAWMGGAKPEKSALYWASLAAVYEAALGYGRKSETLTSACQRSPSLARNTRVLVSKS